PPAWQNATQVEIRLLGLCFFFLLTLCCQEYTQADYNYKDACNRTPEQGLIRVPADEQVCRYSNHVVELVGAGEILRAGVGNVSSHIFNNNSYTLCAALLIQSKLTGKVIGISRKIGNFINQFTIHINLDAAQSNGIEHGVLYSNFL